MFSDKLAVYEYERPEEEGSVLLSNTESLADHMPLLSSPTCVPISLITPLSLYDYYNKCCSVGSYEQIPKLVDQLEGADQLPISIDISGKKSKDHIPRDFNAFI